MSSFTQQVRPVVEPSSIRGLPNGEYPDTALRNITAHDGKIVGRLCREAARAWQAMVAAAWAAGIDLRPSSPADSFRPLKVQQKLFADRYRTSDQGNGSRVCGGKRWYKRKGVATAACPGTSNHGRAIAVDVAGCSGARLRWLEDHAWDFGFAWELVPEEPWHIRYCTGDAVPAAVRAYEQHAPGPVHEEDDMYDPKLDQAILAGLTNLPRNGMVDYGQAGADLNDYRLLRTGELVQLVNGTERRVSLGDGFVPGTLGGPILSNTPAGPGTRVDLTVETAKPEGTVRWFTYDPSRPGFPGRGELPGAAGLVPDGSGWHYVDIKA